MSQRHRDAYPPEFKTTLVALVLAGRSPEELADEFEPSGQTIRDWVRQSQLNAGDQWVRPPAIMRPEWLRVSFG